MSKYALTDSKVKAAKPRDKDYKLPDGRGLYLLVTKAGGKLWRMKFRLNGKEQVSSFGKYPAVGIATARNMADNDRELIAQGIHPLGHRKSEEQLQIDQQQNTFGAIARKWIEVKKPHWSTYYLKQIETLMGRYVFSNKSLNNKPIRAVTASDIREVCISVAKRSKLKEGERKSGSVTMAINLRQWCSAIFCYAISHDKADTDPASALRGLPELKRPEVKFNKSLSKEELIELIHSLDKYTGQRATVIAIMMLLLTFVRTGELRQAKWSEFNFEDNTWRIPAERMKKKKEHWVPLSDQCLFLLEELREITGYSPWLFPNTRRPDDCMSATTINRVLERMGFNGKGSIGFAAHGFRGTASTMLNEMNFDDKHIDIQLSHLVGSQTKRSYDHAKHMPERRAMMQHWADYIDSIKQGANIIPIAARVTKA